MSRKEVTHALAMNDKHALNLNSCHDLCLYTLRLELQDGHIWTVNTDNCKPNFVTLFKLWIYLLHQHCVYDTSLSEYSRNICMRVYTALLTWDY